MKKVWSIFAALALICSCAGCTGKENNSEHSSGFNNEESTNENTEEKLEENSEKNDIQNNIDVKERTFPSDYHYESDYLKIDITSIIPDKVVWYKTTCKDYQIDYEKLGRLFMPDDGSNTMESEQHVILSNEMVDGRYKELYGWGPRSGGYNKLEVELLSGSLRTDMRYKDYNLDEYKEKKDFSFGTEEDIKKKLYEEFSKIDIDLENDFVCDTYYLDYETMREQEKYVEMDIEDKSKYSKRTDWSEDDNAYYMFFHRTCNGLRDFQGDDMGLNKVMNGCAQISLIYNKDGILSCSIQNMYEYTVSNEQVMLMDFDNIMDSVIKHYSDIVDGTKHSIETAELIVDCSYIGSNQRKLIPVWAFWVEDEISDNQEAYISKHELRVNAITGDIIN